MAERQKQNVVQRRAPLQKQDLMDLHSTKLKAIKQSAQPTTDTSQMVRATASSPSDMSHIRTLSIDGKSTSETNSDGPEQTFTPENSDETQQSMSLIKTPGR
jgi:hypothetical protein